jgi:glutamine amidotransferase
MAQFLQSFPIKSKNVIAHIRKARAGSVCVENTHPFHRELWGRSWVFAHNGLLRGIKRRPLTAFHPIGSTDSEHAFCYMLNTIRREFRTPPTLNRLRRLIEELAADLATLGEFNFLLSDSRALFAHCSTKLVYIQRQAPFSRATLADDDLEMDFSTVASPDDRVVVVATAPLTRNEQWHPLTPGSLEVFTEGQRRG